MKIIEVTTKEQLKELYDCSAMTWEGLAEQDYGAALKACCKDGEEGTGYVTSGKVMDEICHLTGNNAYPAGLHIFSIKDFKGLAMQYGARWMDDIIDNNARREDWHPFEDDYSAPIEDEEESYEDDDEDDEEDLDESVNTANGRDFDPDDDEHFMYETDAFNWIRDILAEENEDYADSDAINSWLDECVPYEYIDEDGDKYIYYLRSDIEGIVETQLDEISMGIENRFDDEDWMDQVFANLVDEYVDEHGSTGDAPKRYAQRQMARYKKYRRSREELLDDFVTKYEFLTDAELKANKEMISDLVVNWLTDSNY